MTLWRLITRSLLFFRRTNLGVALAAAVATMILAGALMVGDSVRYSLRRLVQARLGDTQVALVAPNRFCRAALADELAARLHARVAPLIQIRGLMTGAEGAARVPQVQVLGVDSRFFDLAGASDVATRVAEEGVVLNETLARKLNVGLGDEVLLRVAKPGLMPRDVPLTPDSDLSVGFRLTVTAVADESQFGRFSLHSNQISPCNAFVPLSWLAEKIDQPARANLLLAAAAGDTAVDASVANKALADCIRLEDLGLEVRTSPEEGYIEVVGKRVFIDDALSRAVTASGDKPVGILTYFVNELRFGDKTTPYSFVTAIDTHADADMIPPDMGDDEIIINEWLAEDLAASAGDSITLKYYVAGSGERMTEESTAFRIRKIVPLAGLAADGRLTPAFPGLADAEDCRDWKPGVTVDLDRIRKKDETYWDRYRGTPKAFVTLAAGQKMWANRFGSLTAVRFSTAGQSAKDIASHIVQAVDPASAGLFFEAVRAAAVRATEQATDFGGLLLGLSMFLIASSVILLGLVFVFGVEKRSEQSGLLLAVGFPPALVRRLYIVEGVILAGGGAILGVLAALFYTAIMVAALSSVWKGAIGGSIIRFHPGPIGLLAGLLSGVSVSAAAVWMTLRTQFRRPAREFLAGGLREQFLTAPGRSRTALAVAAGGGLSLAAALVILFGFGRGRGTAASGAFFASGALLLTAGLCGLFLIFSWLSRARGIMMRSLGEFALRNTTRRGGRSLAVAALLACGCFLVISVAAFRESPPDAAKRDSGTGGFAFLAETSVPILDGLDRAFASPTASDAAPPPKVESVRFRVREGDDASCLNLNRAQQPRLLGVNPQDLRGAFSFARTLPGAASDDWELLNMDFGDKDIVPAIGDAEMVKWMLGKNVGEDVDYTDERGRAVRLRIVGSLKNSVLQGSLVIAERDFERFYASEDGYRLFLINSAETSAERALLGRFGDFGIILTPTAERLGQLNAVRNTYLSILQVLGGLGLILGSLGLFLVVLINLTERRGELGMFVAIGYAKARIKRMIFYEHALLVGAGVSFGGVSALIAVIPALSGADLPRPMLIGIIAGVAVSALVCIGAAARIALSGDLLEAVRNE